jgi:serine/threonine protein kinase
VQNTYFTDTGSSIHLEAEIGEGGQARIYLIQGYPSDVAKIYKKTQPPEVHMKILTMINNPPQDPTVNGPTRHRSIAWPSYTLYADPQKTRFSGFIMPRIDKTAFQDILYLIDAKYRKNRLLGKFTWMHLANTASNLASCVAAIHEQGYCIGDINTENILASPGTPVTIIDCDSFQVKDPNSTTIWPCPVGRPPYIAPEVGVDGVRTNETDNFALAIIIFQLLMEGFHPYSAKGPLVDDAPGTADKIKKGIFPYTAAANGIAPPPLAPPFSLLPPEVRALFVRAFDAGNKSPSLRPSAKEWWLTLKRVGQSQTFESCPNNPYHKYLSHLNACPWCERAAALGKEFDSFLSPGTVTPPPPPVPVPQPQAQPVIDVDPGQVILNNLSRGQSATATITVTNVGTGVLNGTISTNTQWLRTATNSIGPCGHQQKQEIQLNIANNLPYSFNGQSALYLNTNGGTRTVTVDVSVKPKPPIKLIVGLIIAFIIFISILSYMSGNNSTQQPQLGHPNLQIVRTVIGTDATRDGPVGVSDTFTGPQNKLVSYTTYAGAIPNKTVMTFEWYRNNNLVTTCNPIAVPNANGSFYCTASNYFSEGDYEVRLLVDGVVKARKAFTILASYEPTQPVVPQEPANVAPPPPPPQITEPASSTINITRAVVAAGVNANNEPFGINSSFPTGNRVYYYVTYTGAVPYSTTFQFQLFKGGMQIASSDVTVQYVNGNVATLCNDNFEPGYYQVKLLVDGIEKGTTPFTIFASYQPPPQRAYQPPPPVPRVMPSIPRLYR